MATAEESPKSSTKWESFYKTSGLNKNTFNENQEMRQEARRQELLSYQKKNREMSYNIGRKMLEDALNSESENEEDDLLEEMEYLEENSSKRRPRRRNYRFCNKLLLSEWMLEKPEDFVDKWILLPCPVGKRALVVACKGKTRAFTRKGSQVAKFQSALPGGNMRGGKKSCTILDCIWDKNTKTYYILDLLAWSNQAMIDCDAEFRLYWLKSHLSDIEELKVGNMEYNTYSFALLPSVSCDKAFDYLENFSVNFSLDGFLFYHKEGHYTYGVTPLVTWLKAYMLPEIFNINLPDLFYEKPHDYTNFEDHVRSVMTKKRERIKSEEIDATPSG